MNENVSGLSQLYAEFGFRNLSSKLSAFRNPPSFRDSADAETHSQISALEEWDSQKERRLAALEAKQSQLAQLPAELARIEAAQRQLFYQSFYRLRAKRGADRKTRYI
jgi:hypothetical protein